MASLTETPSGTNHSTRDLASSRPRIRGDLRVHLQDGGYVLEDPLTGRFFTLGAVEYRFLQLLDGSRTVSEVVARLSVEASSGALTEEGASSLLRSLVDANLFEGGGSEHAERVRGEDQRRDDGTRLLRQGRSLLFCRIPIGNPDHLLDRIVPWLGWLVSPGFFLVWVLVVAGGLISVGRHGNRFAEEMAGIFETENLLALGLIWVLLKIFHEGWHALVCKRFGGSVPEMGVVLLLFVTPLGYVNASSATKFPSKWQRIFVSAAGIYGELFAAGLAAMIWAQIEPGFLSRGLHEVIVISSVTTLLFNANPLMRFDGYYILADLTGVPNLYAKAQRSAAFWFRRWFLGANPESHPVPEKDRRHWITVYGIACFLWRVIIVFGILALVSHRWNGAGLVAGLVVLLSMLAAAVQGIARYAGRRAGSEEVTLGRGLTRLGGTLLVLGLILAFVKVNPRQRFPAVVDWVGDGEVRVECPGFVETWHVGNGDEVKAGDLLGRIRNHAEESRLRQLRLELKRARILADQFLQAEDIAAYQAQQRQVAALEVGVRGLENYVETLELRAGCDGVVFVSEAENLPGTFVDKGQLICTVGQREVKRLIIAVEQDHSDGVRGAEGSEATFRARGRLHSFPLMLTRIDPHASTRVPHFGLITPAGGPLVSRRTLNGAEGDGAGEDAETRIRGDAISNVYELTEPHFRAVGSLGEPVSRQLEVGEIGWVTWYAGEPRSIWRMLRDRVEKAYRAAGEDV